MSVRRTCVAIGLAGLLIGAAVPSDAAGGTLDVSRLNVQFVQAEFATHYSVTIAEKGSNPVKYAWRLIPPANDPGCDNLGDLTSRTAEFVWRHGDQHGCDHTKQGPRGHEGTVEVFVTDGVTDCRGAYAGSEGTNGSPTASVPVDCTTKHSAAAGAPPPIQSATPSAAPSPTPSAGPTLVGRPSDDSGGSSFPWIAVIAAAVLAAVAAGWFFLRGSKPDCPELRERCRRLTAEADQAEKDAAAARSAADAARADLDRAHKATLDAERKAAAADRPDPGESWMEDADTGERITEHDLQLQKADEKATGEVHLNDPAHREKLRQQERERAHQALDAARAAESQAKSAADSAAARASDAQSKAAAARSAAQQACAAAAECEEAAAREAAAKEAAAKQPQPPPPTPPVVAPPVTPPVTPPVVTPPVVTGTTSTPPTTTGRRTKKQECEDGCDPRVEEKSIDVEMFLVWAGRVSIDGAFQFSEDDVDAALAGFERWKMIADIAEFGESVAEGAPGDLLQGHVGIESWINVASEGFNQWDPFEWGNPNDVPGTVEDATVEALKKLIEKVNPLRQLGTWTMRCPLVRVHATCTREYECRNGSWVLTKHQFVVEYGAKLRDVDSPPHDNWDRDNPGRGAAATKQWLYRYFANRNRTALGKIAKLAKECAAAK